MYPFVCFVNLTTYPSMSSILCILLLNLSIHLPMNLSTHLFIYLNAYLLSPYLRFCLFADVFLRPAIHLFVYVLVFAAFSFLFVLPASTHMYLHLSIVSLLCMLRILSVSSSISAFCIYVSIRVSV